MGFRYFSPVVGHAVRRYGTKAFVACYRGEGGYKWNEDEVVRIPADEVEQYANEYAQAIRDGALRERTQAEYDAWTAGVERDGRAPFEGLPKE